MDKLNEFFSHYVDKLTTWYNLYYDRVMIWYGALSFFEQMVALFVLFVVVLGIFAYIMIRRTM